MQVLALVAILLIVFLAPFLSRRIEHNLEAFLFVMGVSSALVSRVLELGLLVEALEEPVKITLAVLTFGLVFKYTRHLLRLSIHHILRFIPLRGFLFLVVVVLGLASSMITAIIASLFLVEIISALKLSKRAETSLVIIACFSIGLGAALTPIGEPLSTIAVAKLKGEPYYADFFFLARLLGPWIVVAVLLLGALAAFWREQPSPESLEIPETPETLWMILSRALRVYIFVMALIFLGAGFKPIIDTYVVKWGKEVLYWVNIVSAVLDNATLTAAEISPNMAPGQIKSALIALLISGGMLIQGNIPNIIAAGKLKIGARQWAGLGIPLGLALMVVYFLALEFLG